MKYLIQKEDYKFLAPLFFIFVSSGMMFFFEIGIAQKRERLENPVGKVIVTNNQVKGKVENTYDWKNLKIEDEIYPNDLVFSGENSSASISFITGIVIDLRSNTQIRIPYFLNNVEVILEKGEIVTTFKNAGTATVTMNGEQYVVNSKNQTGKMVFKHDNVKPSYESLDGEVEVNTSEKIK